MVLDRKPRRVRPPFEQSLVPQHAQHRGQTAAKRLLDANQILTLDKTARVLARRDMGERNVTLERAKQWNPGTDQHGNARDNEPLNEPGLEKSLNRDPAIDVDVPDAARSKPGHASHVRTLSYVLRPSTSASTVAMNSV